MHGFELVMRSSTNSEPRHREDIDSFRFISRSLSRCFLAIAQERVHAIVEACGKASKL